MSVHGSDEAQNLLAGAGIPDSGSLSNVREWSLLPERLEKILSTDNTIANDNKMVMFDAWVREKYKRSSLPVQT